MYAHVMFYKLERAGYLTANVMTPLCIYLQMAGLFNNIGGAITSSAHCAFFSGIGHNTYVSSGEFNYILYATVRNTLCYCIIGAGGTFATDAGNMNFVLAYQVTFTGWQAQMIAGSLVYLGAGKPN